MGPSAKGSLKIRGAHCSKEAYREGEPTMFTAAVDSEEEEAGEEHLVKNRNPQPPLTPPFIPSPSIDPYPGSPNLSPSHTTSPNCPSPTPKSLIPTPKSPPPPLKSPPPPPKSLSPTPKSLTPTPKSISPPPKSLTPPPKSPSPTPKSTTPTPKSRTPLLKSPGPLPHQAEEFVAHMANFFSAWAHATHPNVSYSPEPSASTLTPPTNPTVPLAQPSSSRQSIPRVAAVQAFYPIPS